MHEKGMLMSIKELKRRLQEKGVAHGDCVEKADLVARLFGSINSATATTTLTSAPASVAPAPASTSSIDDRARTATPTTSGDGSSSSGGSGSGSSSGSSSGGSGNSNGCDGGGSGGGGGSSEACRVISLVGMVDSNSEDLYDDSLFADLVQDTKEECEKFGAVVTVNIPRPTKLPGGGFSYTVRWFCAKVGYMGVVK
jgi:hypothetical protein